MQFKLLLLDYQMRFYNNNNYSNYNNNYNYNYNYNYNKKPITTNRKSNIDVLYQRLLYFLFFLSLADEIKANEHQIPDHCSRHGHPVSILRSPLMVHVSERVLNNHSGHTLQGKHTRDRNCDLILPVASTANHHGRPMYPYPGPLYRHRRNQCISSRLVAICRRT